VALCEAAWAIARSRNTELSTKFWKIASRRGKKKACIAMARKILVISYHILKNKQPYHEGGPKTVDQASQLTTISKIIAFKHRPKKKKVSGILLPISIKLLLL
jgi:hypothetical protein